MFKFKEFLTESQFDKIDVDGISRHKTNSEGKLIHPTDEGIKNFWRWFGNSKTIDEHGRPLVMYRGMTKPHSDNTESKITYVTPHKEYANLYSDDGEKDNSPNVMKLYAKSESPINLGFRSLQTHVKFKDISDRISNRIQEKFREGSIDRNSALKSLDHLDSGEELHKDKFDKVHNFLNTSDHLHKALTHSGYDSIHNMEGDNAYNSKSPEYHTYGILHQNNIKSAIGNSGEFKSNSANISEQINI